MLRQTRWLVLASLAALIAPFVVEAATLSIDPPNGQLAVGQTFDVALILNTEGQSVNAVGVRLNFPSDKLQIVSPSTGQSIVGMWVKPPVFNNSAGFLDLEGGMPGGYNSTRGIISNITFRIRQSGAADLSFGPESEVLLNDGRATNVLKSKTGAKFTFNMPAPEGPLVRSSTHPDQSVWYRETTATLSWSSGGADEYSYKLSDAMLDVPDDVPEGSRNSVDYKNLASGVHYFHIKSLRNGLWGGTTHFALNIDDDKPADFEVNILPDEETTVRNPVVKFFTTDALSGIDHYEYKLIPLSLALQDANWLFMEAKNPLELSNLQPGNYDVIIRAFDKAGNFREETARLEIEVPLFQIVSGHGVRISDSFTISWPWAYAILVIILGMLVFAAFKVRKLRSEIAHMHKNKILPSETAGRLEELKKMFTKHGRHLPAILLLLSALFMGGKAEAQSLQLAPPVVSSISPNLTNDTAFYVGGTASPRAEVSINIQDPATGWAEEEKVSADQKGEWYFRSAKPLEAGSYILWTQARLGAVQSPPGPQVRFEVTPASLVLGTTRVNYEAFYLILAALLLLAILIFAVHVTLVVISTRRKRKVFMREVHAIEESVKRGFAVLKRDIESELNVLHKAKLNRSLSEEEHRRERSLFADMEAIQRHLEKEIWDMENSKP